MIDYVKRLLNLLFEEYKLVRRLSVLWVFIIVTWITSVVFADLSLITTPVTAAYASVVGMLTTVLVFYGKGREK